MPPRRPAVAMPTYKYVIFYDAAIEAFLVKDVYPTKLSRKKLQAIFGSEFHASFNEAQWTFWHFFPPKNLFAIFRPRMTSCRACTQVVQGVGEILSQPDFQHAENNRHENADHAQDALVRQKSFDLLSSRELRCWWYFRFYSRVKQIAMSLRKTKHFGITHRHITGCIKNSHAPGCPMPRKRRSVSKPRWRIPCTNFRKLRSIPSIEARRILAG